MLVWDATVKAADDDTTSGYHIVYLDDRPTDLTHDANSDPAGAGPIATFLTKRSPVLHISFSNTNVLFVGGVFVPPE